LESERDVAGSSSLESAQRRSVVTFIAKAYATSGGRSVTRVFAAVFFRPLRSRLRDGRSGDRAPLPRGRNTGRLAAKAPSPMVAFWEGRVA
jgi:hypothetical protein